MNNKNESLLFEEFLIGVSPPQVLLEQWVLGKCGSPLNQSWAVHIQLLVSAYVILPGFCWLTSAFIYKFSFSFGRIVG